MHEGRNGWSLSNFMSDIHNTFNEFSPFLQPVDPYKYYGTTQFWIDVLAGSSTGSYYATAVRVGFNGTIGYKSSPSTNDIMYNTSLAAYKKFNGSTWETISESALDFCLKIYQIQACMGN